METTKPNPMRKALWRGQSRAAAARKTHQSKDGRTWIPKDTSSTGASQPGRKAGTPVKNQDWTADRVEEVVHTEDATVAEEVAAMFLEKVFGDVTEDAQQEVEAVTEDPIKVHVYERERKVYSVDCVQQADDDRSWWEKAKDKLALFSALWCCGLESDVRDVRANDKVKRMVSAEMTTSLGLSTYQRGSVNVSRDAIQQVVDSHGMGKSSEGTHRLVVVPAFISSCVVALRMKLGEGATDRKVPGNVELVKAETARLLREYNVRNADAALHQKFIIKAFFDDDTHYRVTDGRARLASKSRFIKWLLSRDEKPHYDC